VTSATSATSAYVIDVTGVPSEADTARVAQLLERTPRGRWSVAVRRPDGDPVVIRTDPLLPDGTPLPTTWWLVGDLERVAIGRLEAGGGVRGANQAVDAEALADAHRRYAAERDAAIPPAYAGPRPKGGVGGTRQGVKCLHAHYAWHLAGGDDPVGRWVAAQLATQLAGQLGAQAAAPARS
jgi:hypothetical protein